MRDKGHTPIRKCIGCGNRRRKEEMLRFFKTKGDGLSILPCDLPGRGFYLCRDITCFEKAQKRGRRIRFLESLDLTILKSHLS